MPALPLRLLQLIQLYITGSGGQLKATKHRVTFEKVPHDVERLSIAYFGKASPDTVLQPLQREGEKLMDDYEANGLKIPAGITVGEYSKLIMAGIYGSGVVEKQPGSNASPDVRAAA
jgi:hypothetical protein